MEYQYIFSLTLTALILIAAILIAVLAYKSGYAEGYEKGKKDAPKYAPLTKEKSLKDEILELGDNALLLQVRHNNIQKQFNLGLIDESEFKRVEKEIRKELENLKAQIN